MQTKDDVRWRMEGLGPVEAVENIGKTNGDATEKCDGDESSYVVISGRAEGTEVTGIVLCTNKA